jgi:hypothetical protein
VSLREVALARGPEARAARVMIWSGAAPADRALSYASFLIDRGVSFEINWNPDETASRSFAVSRGCGWWVNIDGDYALELSTGRRAALLAIGGDA